MFCIRHIQDLQRSEAITAATESGNMEELVRLAQDFRLPELDEEDPRYIEFAEVEKAYTNKVYDSLSESYDLIHVDYDDHLNDEQAALLVQIKTYNRDEDYERFWESFWDWESEARYDGAMFEIDNLRSNFPHSDEVCEVCGGPVIIFDDLDEDDIRITIQERESGNWVDQLIANTPTVVLRASWGSLDDGSFHVPDESDGGLEIVREKMTEIGLEWEDTPHNLAAIDNLVAETYEGDLLNMHVVFNAELSDLSKHVPWGQSLDIKVTNPTVWIGSTFTGTGWAEMIEGTITVPMQSVVLDSDDGYGFCEVFGTDSYSLRDSEIEVFTK